MSDKIFAVTGNKIASLLIDENSLKFSSHKFNSKEDFQSSWNKKISLATKVEIKYDSIKSFRKEDTDKDILIKYKTWAGIPSHCEFAFSDNEDYEIFFNLMVKERYFLRTEQTLTPFEAIRNHAIGLLAVIAFTVFSFYQAIEIENGSVEEAGSGKARMFNLIIEQLGVNGVIAIGVLIICYFVLQIWTRFSNPPNQTRYLSPNA